MGNRYGRIEYGWSRCANNIIDACDFIFKEFFEEIPSYISDLIKKLPSLRYQNAPLIISQNSSKTSLNSRDFKNVGPTLWNSLPSTLKWNFRTLLVPRDERCRIDDFCVVLLWFTFVGYIKCAVATPYTFA